MAEFLNQPVMQELAPLNLMGQPLPSAARAVAYRHARSMGLNPASAWECINGMAEQLERDNPYEAIAVGMRCLDLTGTYRLMAVLLATAAEKAGA